MLRILRSIAFGFRRTKFRLLGRGKLVLEPGVRLGRGVRIRATDGGLIHLHRDTFIGDHSLLVARGGRMVIGARTHCSHGCTLVSQGSLVIGQDCLIGEYVTVRDQDHKTGPNGPDASEFTVEDVLIGDGVWLGAKVTVTRGTVIGNRAIVGANSLVRGALSANQGFGGVPARKLNRQSAN